MKIQVDGVMYQYAQRASAALFYGPHRLPEFESVTHDRTREDVLIASLEFAVMIEASTHRFGARRNMDIFEATPRLIRHWSWVFPGDKLNA